MGFSVEEREKILEYLLDLTNDQIRDFVKDRDLPRSGTKDEHRERVLTAIKQGKLTYTEIVAYLDTLAPWGKQHVFLYSGPPSVRSWRSKEFVRAQLKGKPAEARLGSPLALILPSKIQLSVIDYTPVHLRVVAVRRRDGSYRDERYDEKRKTDEGLQIELRAHVLEVTRGIVAFDWDLLANTAFLQITQLPAGEDYEDAVLEFRELVKDWLDLAMFSSLTVRDAIRRLHELEEAGHTEARSHAISYETKGGRLFGGRSGAADASLLGEVLMDEAMHNLREQGLGNLGNFYWLPKPGTPITEEIHVFLVGGSGRINFTTAQTEPVIRYVLDRIRTHCVAAHQPAAASGSY